MSNKNKKNSLATKIIAIVLAALMVISVATYILYAFAGLL